MLSSYYYKKILKLSGTLIKNIMRDEDSTVFEIEMVRKPHTCPCCAITTQSIHDYHIQKIKDIPPFGSHTILLRKRRIVWEPKGKRFYEETDFLPRYHRMTSRLAFYILSQLALVSFLKSVAQHVNLSDSTVAHVFDTPSYSPTSLPKVLVIDEFKGNTNHEKYQCIITDPESKLVLCQEKVQIKMRNFHTI